MTDLPAPLTPAECDLRGYDFMPFYGERMFTSVTWIAAKPEAKVAALRLWWHSFAKEVPAASLPDDDALLSEYAGYGVAVAAWRKVKAQALRGWAKCADGRLYHKVLAEIALESWQGRKQGSTDAERKQRERDDRKRLFADLDAAGITPKWNIKTAELRDLHRQHVTKTDAPVTGESVTGDSKKSVTTGHDVTARHLDLEEEEEKEPNPPPPESRSPAGANSTVEWIEKRLPLILEKVENIDLTSPGIRNVAALRKLEAEGLDFDADILPALIAVGASWNNPRRPIYSWGLKAFGDMAHANHQRRTENRDAANATPHNGRTSPPRPQSHGLAGALARAEARRAAEAGERGNDDGGHSDPAIDEPASGDPGGDASLGAGV